MRASADPHTALEARSTSTGVRGLGLALTVDLRLSEVRQGLGASWWRASGARPGAVVEADCLIQVCPGELAAAFAAAPTSLGSEPPALEFHRLRTRGCRAPARGQLDPVPARSARTSHPLPDRFQP